MEKIAYIKSIGKGERKRIDFKGKKAFNYAWYYFDWTNNEVYEYGCYQAGVGDEVVIAKVAHREGLRQQFDFHKIKLGQKEYSALKGHFFVHNHFKKSVLVSKMSAAESVKIIAMYKEQYGK